MGTIDHGTQQITFQYFLEATGANFGRRNLDITPVGLYEGGYLTRVSDTQVSLSSFVAEIQDGTNQIAVRSTTVASLSSATLDSGSISSSTPYLVMRWGYQMTGTNYVEIHALSSLSVRQENDLVIGKCVFSGSTLSSFDYSDRSCPKIQDRNLRVEATPDTELYVRVRGGRFNNGSSLVKVADQKVGPFTVPGAGLSRIDLVYINFSGAVAIQPGTAAVSPSAPSYIGKLVLAEVTVVNGDTNITWDQITDSRSFLQHPAIVDETTLGINSSGRMYVVNDLSTKQYDSGWFQVGVSATYTKTHNLGSANLITTLLFAPDSGGAPDLSNIIRVDFHSISSSQEYGGVIQNISSTQLSAVTAGDGVAFKMVNGNDSPYSSGWYKVLALRMD